MLKHQNIVVMYHPQVSGAAEEASSVSEFLRLRGVNVSAGNIYDGDLRKQIRENSFELLIALGGDGTMLRAGHLCAPNQVPILGINMGRFGFLTEISVRDWRELLPRLFETEFWIENRMMLLCEHWQGEDFMGSWLALNEVWVGRGESVRSVQMITRVDGRHLTTYVADGLIISTPTGSTAYALAAGGPILPPDLRNILLVPVAPHLSIDRAIVLAEGSSVNVTVETNHQAVLSVDGQAPIHLTSGDQVHARASDHTCNFIRFQDPGYFYRNLTPHMSNNPVIGINR